MRRRDVLLAGMAAGCAGMSGETSNTQSGSGAAPAQRLPIVIAHRGASGERPEHTLASYRLAIEQGCDYIEPDLVMTKDGVLVCRHENEISGTTDVSTRAEFAERRKEKSVDGITAQGWWVEDFTLAELKTLRAKERLPQLRPQNMAFDGQEEIPTFAEALALSRQHNVGIYPELKHPTFLREQGLDPMLALIGAVQSAGTAPAAQAIADKMIVQCFESGPLTRLASMSSIRWTCVQLVSSQGGPWDRRDTTYAQMLTDAGLEEMRNNGVSGIGAEKSLIIPRDGAGRSLPATDLIARVHAKGMQVHAWTFRAENYFLPAELRRGDNPAAHGDLTAELRAFQAAGVDGVFSDFPAMAVAARV